MKAIKLSVGNVSSDVMSKFIKDESGLFYNDRMENEIIKRNKHSERQRENANKRWNKDECDGINMASATEMPLGNRNRNRNRNRSEDISKREDVFKSEVFEFAEKYPEVMLNKFCNYWTEKNTKGKMRFEFEKTFEISKRLATWASRDKDIVKTDNVLTYEEMLALVDKDPQAGKRYKAVLKPGERKAVYYLIK